MIGLFTYFGKKCIIFYKGNNENKLYNEMIVVMEWTFDGIGTEILLFILGLVNGVVGYKFYLSENGVWFTKKVDVKYFEVMNDFIGSCIMLVITCMGVLILFIIQFILYKKNQNQSLKKILKSEQLLGILKELLIIILGATVALNSTNFEEKEQIKKTVMRLLEVTYNEINLQYVTNEILLDNYEQTIMSAQQVKYNVQYNVTLFENILKNDTVITNISPLIYSILVSDFRNLNLAYDSMEKYSENDEYIIKMVSNINYHNENIMWAIDKEIKHLKGEYTEWELQKLYLEYINSELLKSLI